GAAPPITGTNAVIDGAGVTLRVSGGSLVTVAWDRVRDVVLEPPDDTRLSVLPRYRDDATRLWRARTRVERGDTALAEPLLERLFETYRGQTNETALVIANGLLRCRLARGAHASAVLPALEVIRLRRAGFETESYRNLPPVIDPATQLAPQLAPAWIPGRPLETLDRDLATYDPGNDDVVAAMARLYHHAVRTTLGRPDDPVTLDGDVGRHPGIVRLGLLVACTDPDSDQRNAARRRLLEELDGWPAWAQAWARFGRGVSLLQEPGDGRRRRGMVELLHLPARYGREVPFLTGLALARVAEASRADGETETAAVLEAELVRRFPNHPVRRSASGLRRTAAEDAVR
ncbi:MAG: hypothetical protein HKO59_04960, partial [Phycisphaerales bacterium]|nr:hypothetical protein [Phycisphaerales bacterium]